MLPIRLYYSAKPFIPKGLRRSVRQWFAARKRARVKDIWPIMPGSERPPEGWPGWPDGKQFAFVLTHDVETAAGLEKVRPLAELEMSFGFRSCFNFIPEGPYSVPLPLLSWLREQGFEVGVHDLRHDGHLYRSRDAFARHAKRINHYLKQWGAVGFRSAFMLRKSDWLHELDIAYDMSTFDTDPFEPQPEGVGTIFPFWVPLHETQAIGKREEGRVEGIGSLDKDFSNSRASAISLAPTSSRLAAIPRGYVELPYTLPQDSTLFVYGRETGPEIWKTKLAWIAAHGGMALLDVHPDYIAFNGEPRQGSYPLVHYEALLNHIRREYSRRYWHAIPHEVAAYCQRSRPLRRRDAKRVCMISYSFYESDNRVMRYATALAARGDHVDVIALSRGASAAPHESIKGVNVHRVQHRERNEKNRLAYSQRILRFLFSSSLELTRRHFRQPYDVVHVHNVPDFLIFAAWLPKLTGARIILDIHDIVPEFYASKFSSNSHRLTVDVLKLLERVSSRFAHHVIISNDLWYQTLTTRSARRDKCSVLINYVDRDVFQRRERVRNDGRLIVIYPGGLQWHQGLDIAIRAFARVVERLPSAEFNIYGEGPMKSTLIELTQTLALVGKVCFFASLPIDEIASIVSQADLGVVPKRSDSFGDQAYSTKIMEFMALGIPVVVSKTSIDSYYFNDTLVRFFESGNVDALTEAMVEMLTDQDLRDRLAANALLFAVQNDWESKKADYFRVVDAMPTWEKSHSVQLIRRVEVSAARGESPAGQMCACDAERPAG